ncbi:MAG: D-2-hydroxyacid dehydrogenase [Vallitalea sp.]|jgi:glycerate dehydrogenase|nr:D-2-hydroxyacid dehydrogenase [Vallitalea sp.]
MKIVILDSNTLGNDLDLGVFNELGEVEVYGFTAKEQVIDRIKDVDVIITNKVVLNESNLQYAANLKLICLTATGTNNVDKNYTNSSNIVVSNVVGYSTDSVAQHTFAILFYLYEKLSYYDKYVKSGEYVNDEIFTHFDRKFNELVGKTWGIVGLGNIGKKVASIAKAFGCNIIYYSTSGKNNNAEYERVDIDTLLSSSDIISIHAPLNKDTDNLFTYDIIKKMKKSAVLLNLGRGKIINEEDLTKALEEDIIAGAGLDVLEYEPINEDNPLLKIQDSTKLLVTPHIAWASIEARNRVVREVKENIISFQEGSPRNVVVK